MAHISRRWTAVMALATSLALSACGDKSSQSKVSEADLLSHVAADTPYVFTNVESMPPDLTAKLLRYVSADLTSTSREMQAALTDSEAANPKVAALVRAVLGELDGMLTPEGIKQLGFRMDAHAVLYGMGMLPVLRMELGNPQAVKDLAKRIETKSGLTAPTAKFGELDYWRFDLDRAVLVAAVVDEQFVVAMLPADGETRYLPQLFGSERPAKSLAESPILAQLLEEYGFTGNGEGYIDFVAVSRALLGEDTGANGETWREVVPARGESPPPQCAALVKRLVDSVPRYVVGTREADAQHYVMRSVVETSPEVAARLQKLAAPVPGLGSHGNALVSLGGGMNMPELREAIGALIRTVSAEGKGCDWIDQGELDQTMASVNLVLGPFATVAKGFYFEAQDLEVDPTTSMPSKFRGGVLVASDDPRGLLALASMASPPLASMDVPADGTPVAVPDDALPPEAPQVYVATTDKALVVAAGDGAAQAATALLNATLVQPAPLFALTYDASRLMPRLSELSGGLARALEAEGKTKEADALQGQVARLATYGDIFDSVSMSVTASGKGLVVEHAVGLK